MESDQKEIQKVNIAVKTWPKRAAWVSVILSIVVFLIKFAGYFQTHSTAILSDALESTVNVVAAIVALFVIRFVAAPADENHPYGHGKIEYFSSAFEGGLIAFAAIVIAYGSIKALLAGIVLHDLEKGIAWVAASGAINLGLGYYLLKEGRTHQSIALEASGHHVLSDVWSTVGVLLGLALVHVTHWVWLDPVIALLVALQLAWTGIGLVRKSISGLTDEMEPETIEQIVKAFERVRRPGLIDVHHVKVIRSGKFHHIDGHIVVPEFWSVTEAHASSNTFEKELLSHYGFDGEIAFHLDPCQKQYCSRCDVMDCPIRERPFQAKSKVDVKHLISGPKKDIVL